MEITDKDVYETIVHSADDRTVLNMLSVNKKFNNDEAFRRVLLKRYPHLLAFRREGESWKALYLRMIYYIDKLQREFDFPYIGYAKFSPEYAYKKYTKNKYEGKIHLVWESGLLNSVRANRFDLVKYFLNKGAKNIDVAYGFAVHFHNTNLMKFFESLNINYNIGLYYGALGNHFNLVKYLINEKEANDFNLALSATSNWKIIDYLVNEKGANNFNRALKFVAEKKNWKELADYFIEKGGDIEIAFYSSIKFGNIEAMKYFVEKGANVFIQAFNLAIYYNKLNSIKYLIEEMGNRNLELPNLREITVRLITEEEEISEEKLVIVKYLIETFPERFNIPELLKLSELHGKMNLYNYLNKNESK